LELWTETDGTIEWLKEYIVDKELEPPSVPTLVDVDSEKGKAKQSADGNGTVKPNVDETGNKDQEEEVAEDDDDDEEDEEEDKDATIQHLHAMFNDMFFTGCEAIEESLTAGELS
jgi:hypothetical protein